jgi:hypothetical protein
MGKARKTCGFCGVSAISSAHRILRGGRRHELAACRTAKLRVAARRGGDGMKGAQKPKKVTKKPAQKTLKEKRQEKRNAAKGTSGLQ